MLIQEMEYTLLYYKSLLENYGAEHTKLLSDIAKGLDSVDTTKVEIIIYLE